MSQQPYSIVQASLSSAKFLDKDDTLDLTNRIIELQLYEDVDKAFITGKVAILDDLDLVNVLKFRGTEKITFVISNDINNTENVIKKTFIMHRIEQVKKENERRQALIISLVEPHFYHNSLTKISKSYTNSVENIVKTICKDELNKDVFQIAQETSLGSIKVVIPYLRPLAACNWLVDRASTINGSPYFLHASVFSEDLMLRNLESMLMAPHVNRIPYKDSQIQEERPGSVAPSSEFQIEAMSFADLHNTLGMTRNGAIGSMISNTNIGTGTIQSQKFMIASILEKYKKKNIITTYQNVYEEFNKIEIGDKANLDYAYNSENFHTLNSSGTYENQKGYYDDVDDVNLVKRVETQAMRLALLKNTIDIFVPGAFLFANTVGVGQKVKTQFLNSKINNNDGNEFDQDRSGDYIILKAKHVFTTGTLKSALTLGRVSSSRELPNIDQYDASLG